MSWFGGIPVPSTSDFFAEGLRARGYLTEISF